MKKGRISNIILTILLLGLVIGTTSAWTFRVTPDPYTQNTIYDYVLNFTNSSSCSTSSVILSHTESITTDEAGTTIIEVDISNISQIPTHLCETRDGSLRRTHNMSDIVFRSVYVNLLNATGNITASNFRGNLNASYIQNEGWISWEEATNQTLNDTINAFLGNGTFVLSSRTLTAGQGLSGGGDLSADRSFSVAFGTSFLGWGNLTSYPSACSSSQTITTIGDTITCSSISITESQVSDLQSYLLWSNAVNGTLALNSSLADYTRWSEAINGTLALSSRTLTAGAGLGGGGDLSADRTFDINFGTSFLQWSNLTNYPSDCALGSYAIGVGDTLTCTADPLDTIAEWQTLCTDCVEVSDIGDILDSSHITDIYLFNTGDTATGNYTFDSGTLFIDSTNNRVGIGTASPDTLLHVESSIGNSFKTSLISDVDINLNRTDRSKRSRLQFMTSGGSLIWQVGQAGNSDVFTISESGVGNYFTIQNGTGNVGIGTTSPSAKLHIDTTDNSTIPFRINGTNGTGTSVTHFYIQNGSGRVGIGTTSPSTTLHVVRDFSTDGNTIRDVGIFDRLYSGGAGANNIGSRISFRAESETEGTIAIMGRIGGLLLDATVGTIDGALIFETVLNDVISEKMRIDNSGNVGIGTQSPTQLLSVNGSGLIANFTGSAHTDTVILHASNGSLVLEGANTGSSAPIFQLKWDNNDSGSYTAAQIDSFNAGSVQDGDLRFYTTQAGILAEQMRIDEDGNVGIGTSSPLSTLEVSGTLNVGTVGTAVPTDTQMLLETARDKMLHLKSSGGGSQLFIETTGGGDPQIAIKESGSDVWTFRVDTSEDSDLEFQINGADVMELHKNKNVTFNGRIGIGQLNPFDPLDVLGYINSSIGFKVNSSVGFTGSCASSTTITVKGGIITGCS